MPDSLYIHIPFCKNKCLYCDFYSVRYHADLARQYIKVLCTQIQGLKNPLSTIYIGGGTPSVLDTKSLESLLDALGILLKDEVEFTVEANPESLSVEKIKILRDHGVNRLSIGVQSFDDDILRKLGRIHNSSTAIKSVELSQRYGFDNINIDLMFGIWGEDLEMWKNDLRKAVALPITHVSAYALTSEKATPLFNKIRKQQIPPLDDETSAMMYSYAMEYLTKKGFFQYEISNFAKKDARCKHNLNYWDNREYLGFGAGAVSYIKGVRSKYADDVNEYIKKVRQNREPIVFREKLNRIRHAKETAAIKIRTKEGINARWFMQSTGFGIFTLQHQSLGDLTAKGLVKVTKNCVKLSRKGFLFSDTVSSEFL